MRLVVAHRTRDLPVADTDFGALVEMLVEFVSLGAQGKVLPDLLLNLRYTRVVLIELRRNELAACPFRRSVDPREVRHGAAIEPNAGANGGVAIVGQLDGVNNVRWDQPPAVAFQPCALSTNAELHRLRFVVVGLQVFVIRCQAPEHEILAIGMLAIRSGSFDFDVIPTRVRHTGLTQFAEE